MKIVVYGTWRRVGALVGDQVIDLNPAFARYVCERRPDAQSQADERVRGKGAGGRVGAGSAG